MTIVEDPTGSAETGNPGVSRTLLAPGMVVRHRADGWTATVLQVGDAIVQLDVPGPGDVADPDVDDDDRSWWPADQFVPIGVLVRSGRTITITTGDGSEVTVTPRGHRHHLRIAAGQHTAGADLTAAAAAELGRALVLAGGDRVALLRAAADALLAAMYGGGWDPQVRAAWEHTRTALTAPGVPQ